MIKKVSKKEYTDFWRKNKGSCMQSWAWGEFKSYAWDVERLGIYLDNSLVSIVSVHIRKLPFSFLTKFMGINSFAYIPRGLVVDDVSITQKALDELDNYLKKMKISFVLIDPENNVFEKNWNEYLREALEKNGWKKEGVTIQPNQTNMIRIDKSDDELFQSFRPKWRRNIKKAKRHGLKAIDVNDESAVKKFYSILIDVGKRTDFKCHGLSYFQKMWNELKKDDEIRIFTAELKGEVLASYLILVGENVVYETYGGSTLKGRDYEASFLLKWEVIKKMRDEGKVYYDQWGVAPKDIKNHPLEGISYFKSGFGGEYIEFLPQYIKVYNKRGYKIYKMLKK